MTDALEMRAISATIGVEEGAVRALRAGADALCLGHDLADDALVVDPATRSWTPSGRAGSRRAGSSKPRRACAPTARLGRRSQREPADVDERRRRRGRPPCAAVEGDPTLARAPLVVDLEPRAEHRRRRARRARASGFGVRCPSAEVVALRTKAIGRRCRTLDGRQLVVVVRDAHRHAWQQAAVERAARRRRRRDRARGRSPALAPERRRGLSRDVRRRAREPRSRRRARMAETAAAELYSRPATRGGAVW